LINYVARVGWPAETEYEPGVLYRLTPSGPAYATEAETVAAIIAETTKAANDEGGRPLPLAATWNNGEKVSDQIAKIEGGYPVIPHFVWWKAGTSGQLLSQLDDLPGIVSRGLPIAPASGGFAFDGDLFQSTTFRALSEADTGEMVLVRQISAITVNGSTSITVTTSVAHEYRTGAQVRFANLTGDWAALNGNYYDVASLPSTSSITINLDASTYAAWSSGGQVVGRSGAVSPWGASSAWYANGLEWSTHPQAEYLQAQYPNPPRVILLANNETGRISFERYQVEARYQAAYADYATRTDAQKLADGHYRWITQYENMFEGLADGFTEAAWANHATVGYVAMPSIRFGTHFAWWASSISQNYSNAFVPDTYNRLAWDWWVWGGASPEVYDNHWQGGGTTGYVASATASSVSVPSLMVSGTDRTYRYHEIEILSGTGAGQKRRATEYTASTQSCDISPNWDVVPDTSSLVFFSTYPNSWKTPFTIWSPQNESMTLKFMRDIAESVNADYWFEMSIWDGEMWEDADGYESNPNHPKALKYRRLGLDVSPDYYKGWIQYCLWVCQPRCLREFRYHVPATDSPLYEDYWQKVLDCVAHPHQHATLRRFWREGVLVENPTVIGNFRGFDQTHPYMYNAESLMGSAWAGLPKNYHLTTSIDPTVLDTAVPWTPYIENVFVGGDNKEWPVYTLAYRIGTTPNREYLIYAHSTGIGGSTLTDVVVTVPDFDDVTLPTVPVEGAFYYIKEAA
jgi:hypothetical protein